MPDQKSSPDGRRSFLQKIIGIGALAVAPKVTVERVVEDRMTYKGYELVWSGWKQMPDQDTSVGQWTALRHNEKGEIDGFGFYASYPGGEGIYYPGQIFNCCMFDDQLPILASTSEENKEQAKLDALQRVMAGIDVGATKPGVTLAEKKTRL